MPLMQHQQPDEFTTTCFGMPSASSPAQDPPPDGSDPEAVTKPTKEKTKKLASAKVTRLELFL